MVRHLTDLAFLSPEEIPAAFGMLKMVMPVETKPLVDWFEDVYVNGKERSKYYGRLRKTIDWTFHAPLTL